MVRVSAAPSHRRRGFRRRGSPRARGGRPGVAPGPGQAPAGGRRPGAAAHRRTRRSRSGSLTAHHLAGHKGERVDVGPGGHLASPALLGRHVRWASHHRSGLGAEPAVSASPSPTTGQFPNRDHRAERSRAGTSITFPGLKSRCTSLRRMDGGEPLRHLLRAAEAHPSGRTGLRRRRRSASVSPSRNSMVTKATGFPSGPGPSWKSKRRQTLGWVTPRASCTSRRSRSSKPWALAADARTVFSATVACSRRSRAS